MQPYGGMSPGFCPSCIKHSDGLITPEGGQTASRTCSEKHQKAISFYLYLSVMYHAYF